MHFSWADNIYLTSHTGLFDGAGVGVLVGIGSDGDAVGI